MLVPGDCDCDFDNGEKPLTAEKVRNIAYSFLEYGIIDKNHDYFQAKKSYGVPVESFILDEPKAMKNVNGDSRTYPVGTWCIKSEITDQTAKKQVEDGIFTGYSVTVVSKRDAANMSMKGRVNISDLENPIAVTVSLVREPCQPGAKFCNISNKENPEEDKGSTIEQIAKAVISAITKLSNINEGETMPEDDKKKKKNPFAKDEETEETAGETEETTEENAEETSGEAEAEETEEDKKTKKTEEGYVTTSDLEQLKTEILKAIRSELGNSSEEIEEEDEEVEEEAEEETTENQKKKPVRKSLKNHKSNASKKQVLDTYDYLGRDYMGRSR